MFSVSGLGCWTGLLGWVAGLGIWAGFLDGVLEPVGIGR